MLYILNTISSHRTTLKLQISKGISVKTITASEFACEIKFDSPYKSITFNVNKCITIYPLTTGRIKINYNVGIGYCHILDIIKIYANWATLHNNHNPASLYGISFGYVTTL